ncbi:alpha/beta-hydrolase [Lepidopterella palustris CBS 459.81]|uniref:Alpha/beta-hydrolase n=1 Tax=Lepidopterella palustris CBS 459.81 TaxID=1314670 RepID=A0A8E2E2B3_9PEZI|nr:alpha/beta-hydrolase [Lepidopterella palustris CBS 459.81]
MRHQKGCLAAVFSYTHDERIAEIRQRAERYSNTALANGAYQAWDCTEEKAQLVSIAARCAKAVYPGESLPDIPRHSIRQTFRLEPSLDGLTKASALYVVERVSIDEGRLTTIVVSIRGSKSIVDWMVNANNPAADAKDFINMEALNMLTGQNDTSALLVHRGFLASARELAPKIRPHLESALRSNPGSIDVIFTGHSAGGAVASLLFTHFFSNAFMLYNFLDAAHIRLSVITFGAPPIFSRDIHPVFSNIPSGLIGRGVLWSIINEGDPIPRADDAYIRVLLRFVQKTDAASTPASLPAPTNRFLSFTQRGSSKPRQQLPPLSLHALGTLIVLRDANADAADLDAEEDLRAEVLRRQELETLLFANFFAHKMDSYLEGVDLVARGEVNGKSGWLQSGLNRVERVQLEQWL